MSIKNKVRTTLQKNKVFNNYYEIYHKYAKHFYNRNNPKVILNSDVSAIFFKEGTQTFFGYYDKTPVSNKNYLYHVVDDYELNLERTIEINLNHHKISETNTWNWQQGSMLSWLNDDEIIHNYFDEGFKAKIINTINDEVRVIDFPIYSISSDGEFSISLNFTRLANLRPDYGYFNRNYSEIEKCPKDDGLFYVDLEKNNFKLLLSLNLLSEFLPRESMKNAYHKVNHVMISPNNEKIIFLHRWYDTNNKKYTRLIAYHLQSNEIKLLADDDMVSHCNWKNDNEVIGYLRYQGKDGYYIINVNTGEVQPICQELEFDGHPSITKDERWMLTDTYPDHTCKSKVILYDFDNKVTHILGEFYSPLKFEGINRCDHHPRFNDDESKITFDTVCNGTRQMCELDISKIINK